MQAFLPSGQLPILPNDARLTLQPGQSSVIRPDDEFTSEQVLLELLDEVNDSQKFLTRGAVFPLRLLVHSAGVAMDHLHFPCL